LKGSHQTAIHVVSLANVHGIRKKILFSRMRQISPMRICNFENFLEVIPRSPLKGERLGKEGVRQGNGREGKIEGLGRR
jgi:hypothetical protein